MLRAATNKHSPALWSWKGTTKYHCCHQRVHRCQLQLSSSSSSICSEHHHLCPLPSSASSAMSSATFGTCHLPHIGHYDCCIWSILRLWRCVPFATFGTATCCSKAFLKTWLKNLLKSLKSGEFTGGFFAKEQRLRHRRSVAGERGIRTAS